MYTSSYEYTFVNGYDKKKTERKVKAREQKHAKREDNDRFRNYSCICVCKEREVAMKRNVQYTLA